MEQPTIEQIRTMRKQLEEIAPSLDEAVQSLLSPLIAYSKRLEYRLSVERQKIVELEHRIDDIVTIGE